MRKSTSLTGSSAVRPAILVASLLTIAAIGILQVLPSAAANADEVALSPEPGRMLGTTSEPDDAVRLRVKDTYGKLPVYFEANRGQTDPRVKFLSRGSDHTPRSRDPIPYRRRDW